MKWRCFATVALLLHAALGWTAQLTPQLEGEELSVLVESTAWPATLHKDLTSGLTTRILIRATLARGADVAQRRAIEIAVRYDLWDEHFVLSMSLDGVEAAPRTIARTDDMLATLQALRLTRVFATAGMAPSQPHTVSTEILLNPVDRERMEMIKKWVAENSIAPADIRRRNGGGSLSVAIFNRIFEEYSKGADLAAVWRETSLSRPFRLEDLVHEGE